MGLETVELILLAEEHFHLKMTDEDTRAVVTIADFTHLICQLTQRRGEVVSEADVSSWLVDTLVVDFGIDPDAIHAEARFVQDLGLD